VDKQQKLKIALPVLAVIMAFVYGPLIFGSGSKDKTNKKTGSVSNSMQKNAVSFDLAALSQSRSQKKAKTAYTEWGQNPFMLKRAPKALNIEGIMWDEKNPKAIINGDIVGIGENIESKTIIDIKPNSVIFVGDDGKEVELTY